jgi:hypothetical protein
MGLDKARPTAPKANPVRTPQSTNGAPTPQTDDNSRSHIELRLPLLICRPRPSPATLTVAVPPVPTMTGTIPPFPTPPLPKRLSPSTIKLDSPRAHASESSSPPDIECPDRHWAPIVLGDLPATRAAELGLIKVHHPPRPRPPRHLRHRPRALLQRIVLINRAQSRANRAGAEGV